MTTFALTDATIWVAGYDFTGDSNEVALSASADELDCTTFGSGGFRARKAGLKSVEARVAGYWDAGPGAVDAEAFNGLAVADRVVTIAPSNAETTPAYMFRGGQFSYELFGQVGEMTPFSLNMLNTNSQGLIRGQVAKAKGSVSTAGPLGSVVNLGPVAANQYLYAALHVFSAGTTLNLQIQSDNAAGFATPTTVTTLPPVTVAGGTWMVRVPGPLTDTHYRFNVSGVALPFTVAAAIGIGS
ncbi:hypothetical protein V6U89_29835 [Micromonospora sp. CPCC 206171]|uniref:hypothetical protein n=1 Tax=Micromonospora sp. CPCC 206171 TaxID=3122405 RepID=UPI002FF3D832